VTTGVGRTVGATLGGVLPHATSTTATIAPSATDEACAPSPRVDGVRMAREG